MENQKTMTAPKENILGTEKISKLLLKFAIPGIISMLVNALYNIIDQIFIGWSPAGFYGNGATNIVFPMATLALAFSLLVGDGAASFMSLMLGRKRERNAALGVSCTLIFSVVFGIIMAIIYISFLTPLCILFGASGETLEYARQYGFIIALGFPVSGISVGYAGVIRADGSPRYNMVGLLVGCIINIILDPIFIFTFNMGVAGAAVATVLGQLANAIIYLCYIPRFKTVKIDKSTLKESFSVLPQVLKLGLSSFINQAVLVVLITVQNNVLRAHGPNSVYGLDIPIAAIGVTMKVFNILLSVCIGLSAGAQPIWGYNYGSGRIDRVKKTYWIVAIIATILMTVAFVIFQLFPRTIVSIFGKDEEIYMQFCEKCMTIFLFGLPLEGIRIITAPFFQSVGKPLYSSILSFSKQILFQMPAMIFMPLINNLGVEGVLYSGPISDILSFILTIALILISRKELFGHKAHAPKNAQVEITAKPSETVACEPFVISIGRSYGGGGRSVGKEVAKMLGVAYYDSELIKRAAEQSGLNESFLISHDEKPVGSQLGSVDELVERAQAQAVESVAQKGACVIVGRRADLLLKGKVKLLRVFVTAPSELRAERISEREGISLEESKKKIARIDKEREKYYNELAGKGWGEAYNYDICIDCSKMSIASAAEIIVSAFNSIYKN